MASKQPNLETNDEENNRCPENSKISLKVKSDAFFGCPEDTPSNSKIECNLKTSTHNKGVSKADEANSVLLEAMTEMGMDRYLSKKALICTGNKSVDVALGWIGELGAEEMEALCSKNVSEENEVDSNRSSDWEDCEEEEEEIYYKMVFVVNMEYGMGMGKVASQVGHAAIGLYRLLKEDSEKFLSSLEEWEETGEKKITLRGKNVKELLQLQQNAEKNDLPTYLIEDAGKTQIPEGAITVLGIFGDEEAVNEVTGGLRLL